MMKLKVIGDSYALFSGGGESGEGGILSLRVVGDESIVALAVNGRAFPVHGAVSSVPVTAFQTGSNRISLHRADGRVIPAESIRLTGGLFYPEGAGVGDVIAACDKRFAALDASLRALAARVQALEEDTGILP